MSTTPLLQAFATVFPAELPDKTMIATILLVARYRRPGWVWTGAVTAFAVHVTVAVAAGSVLGLLPDTLVQAVVAALFATGAVVLFRSAKHPPEEAAEDHTVIGSTARAAALGSFGMILVAEWGDLTQLATASLAARSGAPLATGIGAWAALASVAAIAAAFGRRLVERFPIQRINYVGAAVFAGLATWTLVDLAM